MWYTIYNKVQAGYKSVIKKVGVGWQFIVELVDKVWEFLHTNAPQLAEAMQKVLETVTQGWEWLKKKFAFIFSWGDILSIKNVFVNLTTQGYLVGCRQHGYLGAEGPRILRRPAPEGSHDESHEASFGPGQTES